MVGVRSVSLDGNPLRDLSQRESRGDIIGISWEGVVLGVLVNVDSRTVGVDLLGKEAKVPEATLDIVPSRLLLLKDLPLPLNQLSIMPFYLQACENGPHANEYCDCSNKYQEEDGPPWQSPG